MRKDFEIIMKDIKLVAMDCNGILTDGSMYYLENGLQMKRFHVLDDMGFVLLKRHGILTAIISGEENALIAKRAEELQADYLVMGESDKLEALRAICKEREIEFTECAYIGDDVNDLPAMRACGLSFAPPNAHPVVRNSGAYVTAATGGNGCFREVADQILEKYIRQSW